MSTQYAYDEEKVTAYNRLADFFWSMGDGRQEIAAAFIHGNPDFYSFWKLYTVMALLKEMGKTKTKAGSVYFLRDDNSGNVKIGYTKGCAVTRTNQIKGMNHTPLTLLFHIHADNTCESRLHKLLRPSNIHHEWFDGASVQKVISFLEPIKESGDVLTAGMIEGFTASQLQLEAK